MNKKNSIKQHYIAILLFILGNYMLTHSLFSKKLQEKISNISRSIKDDKAQKNFSSNQIPRDKVDLKELEETIKQLFEENQQLKKTLAGKTATQIPTHEKVNTIAKNAEELSIRVDRSGFDTTKGKKVYYLEFSCNFPTLVEFINRSYHKPGHINVEKLSIENANHALKNRLEFGL